MSKVPMALDSRATHLRAQTAPAGLAQQSLAFPVSGTLIDLRLPAGAR